MRILHAIQGLPIAAGTTTFVVNVSNEMARMGHEVTVAVYCEPTDGDKSLFDDAVRVVSIPSVLKLKKGDFHIDIVHIHSMWNIWLHRVAVWCRRNGVPYVCSPHGSATPWALRYKWIRKHIAWTLYQRKDFALSAAIHVTVAEEARDIARLGLKNHVITAPLGVYAPDVLPVAKKKDGRFIFLFVGRIQRKKGLENLIYAIARLQKTDVISHIRDAPIFRIVGPDQESHLSELYALAEKHGVLDFLDFVGPKYGADLSVEYSNADVFVLPTFSENFAVVVADALAHGLPVITTKGSPWRELVEFHCGWWVDIGVEPLAAALSSALCMRRDELWSMGSAGRELVRRHYSWETVVGKLELGYMNVLMGLR